jgi:hypothetical protein
MPSFDPRTAAVMDLPVFIPEKVRAALIESKNSNSCGPDGCPSMILKHYPELCIPLSTIFNMSMKQQLVPNAWKLANVIPIYKGKGSRLDVENYRPISLTNVFCKLMEKLISKKIINFLDTNNLLSSAQSGFRSSRSTLSQLLLAQAQLVDCINKRTCVDSVYTDMSKAFDSLSHKKLIVKLRAYGINSFVCQWIQAFLSNRRQRVVVNSGMSDWLQCTSGVPQGSVLGSLLFNIYINDLPDCVHHSNIYLYADDAKMFKSINCRLDCLLFQQDIDSISAWCTLWQLKLNILKCLYIRYGLVNRPTFDYSISGILLKKVMSTKDLGVVFDSKLSFSEQCNDVVNKGFMRANMLLKCFQSRDRRLQINLFNTFVRPILEFNSPVWSPHLIKDVTAIERVQKYFTKNLKGLKNKTYNQRLIILNQPTLQSRRIRADMIYLFKILHGLVDMNLKRLFPVNTSAYSFNLRGHAFMLYAPKPRTDLLKFSYVYRAIKCWNSLPTYVCDTDSLSVFKNRLTVHLLQHNV